MKLSKKIHLILKAVKMTLLGYKAETLRNKIKKNYYKRGTDDNNHLRRMLNKYNAIMVKFNEVDISYIKLRDSFYHT
jgi:hypothetical protein